MAAAVPLKPTGLELWLLEAGEDLQDSLTTLAEARRINGGLIVSGVGSLSTLSTANPTGPEFLPPMQPLEANGPFEIVGIAGAIGEVAVRNDRIHPKVTRTSRYQGRTAEYSADP